MREIAIVWDDPETGLRCKARIDFVSEYDGWTVVGDLKSSINAAPKQWARAVANYGYHRQAAFYLDGCNAISPHDRLFAWIIQEKDDPFS